ncbi:hypothetical protein HanRHA438_Chr13g0624471 [Helianthus annuus]|nr:hypothetical protein HanRHA438_Chr13g0624471 [Helianthus annuus]
MDVYAAGSVKIKKAIHAVCLTTMWVLWKMRNDMVFNHLSPSVQNSVANIKSLSFLWVKHRSKVSALDWEIWNGFNLHKVGW